MREGNNVMVTISTGTIVKSILFIILIAFLFYIRDTLLILLTAVVIASALEPFTRWFEKWGIPRLPSVMLVYMVIATFVVGAVYFVAPIFLNELQSMLAYLPRYLGANAVNTDLSVLHILQPLSGGSDSYSLGDVITQARTLINGIAQGTWTALIAFSGGLFSFVLITVLSFYLCVQKTGVDDFLEIVTPPKYNNYVQGLWRRSQFKIGRWMQGQILLAFIVGAIVTPFLFIFGVPHAALLGLLAALFEIIPVFGPIMAAIPAVSIAFVNDGVQLALIVTGLFVIVQQFENHLIYPLVVKKVVGVPALLVILALIIGAQVAGILGIILSVPLAAVIRELVTDIQKGRKELSSAVES